MDNYSGLCHFIKLHGALAQIRIARFVAWATGIYQTYPQLINKTRRRKTPLDKSPEEFIKLLQKGNGLLLKLLRYDVYLDGGNHLRVQAYGNLVFASKLDGIFNLNFALVNVHATRCHCIGNVRGGDGAEQAASSASLGGDYYRLSG